MHSGEARTKNILAKIYASQFESGGRPKDDLALALLADVDGLNQELENLEARGLVRLEGGRPHLTPSGRKLITVVMTGGAFDIIHPGHIETLEQARELGDALIVSVARDSTFERNKKRKPQHSEALRKNLVAAIRTVDCAVLGSETDIFETVELLKPDIIALGYDQLHDEFKISDEVKKRGLDVKVVRLKASNPDIKTSAIINDHSSSGSSF
jgi:cytidyltransferase-like protein